MNLAALGDGIKRVEPNEEQSKIVQRRCLRVVNSLKKGHILKNEDFISLRPISEGGIEPYEINNLIGKQLLEDIESGEHITKKWLIMIKGKKVGLRAVEKEDLILLRDWRNLTDFRKHFREVRELSLTDQEEWFESLQKQNT